MEREENESYVEGSIRGRAQEKYTQRVVEINERGAGQISGNRFGDRIGNNTGDRTGIEGRENGNRSFEGARKRLGV